VTSVDKATGIVEVTSAGMSLRVHFPPASVADLKAGDKIILHLGYSVSQ
jgi:hydrogenase maturation factor